MKILCVSPLLPVPAVRGAGIRIVNLLRELSQTEEIDLLSMDPLNVEEEDLAPLRQCCRHIHLALPAASSRALKLVSTIGMAARGIPFASRNMVSPDIRRRLRRLTEEGGYDIVQVEHSIGAPLIDSIAPGRRVKTVLTLHNVGWLQYRRMYRFEKAFVPKCKLLLTWIPLRFREGAMAARFDKVITVSDVDTQHLRALREDLDVDCVPNGVGTREIRPFPREGRGLDMVFVGAMDYAPNADGILDFCANVLPIVRAGLPECTLTIVGQSPPPSVMALARIPGVSVCPDVKDVRPFYEKAMVSVVPLRSGGGTRLKILEAMATGTPVVSTSLGCEGLAVEDGRDIRIADRPVEIAAGIQELMQDPSLWVSISTRARCLVEECYDWRIIAKRLREIYVRLVQNGNSQS
jgi:glycosyltransferase involved in cell wall biosynthesis